jgi:hypothetical protein
MFFNTRTYLRLLHASFFGRRDIPTGLRRSLVFCFVFLTLFAAFELFTALCLLLDEVIVRRYRRIALREPIFVIGNPRSGTTILHRVMACDAERFFFFRTWEIAFPSVVQKRILSALGALDRLAGAPLHRLVERLEAGRLATLNRFHEFGLFKPEEDDKLLLHILASPDLVFFFPYGGFDALVKFDLVVSPPERRAAMAFYANCIQRQAHFRGSHKTLLSKSPWASARVDSLARQFPDCKFVYLVRNPLDVVASIISFSRAIVREISGVEPGSDHDEAAYEVVKFFYHHPLERLAALPPERYIIVNYDDLLRQPRLVFERIYRHFGLGLTPAFEVRLDDETARMRRHQSRHHYALDQCSVSCERILADLRPIFERFGFDTREPSGPAEPTAASAPRTAEAGHGDRSAGHV